MRLSHVFLEMLRLQTKAVCLCFCCLGLLQSLIPFLQGLVQLTGTHGLHIMLHHETLPLLRIRQGQELEGFGVRQIPKRLGVCRASE